MPKITKISYNPRNDRHWIYIDGEYCTAIRARTFKAMDLQVGQEISCEQVKDRENFHFKHQYQNTWEQEKVRIDRVCKLIHYLNPGVETRVTGFGADTTEMIKAHPDEAGKPDIEVWRKEGSRLLMRVEVTGTERMRGDDFWIRPDKLKYCQNHPEQNVWIILHYAQPKERFVLVKPDGRKQYPYKVVNIRGTDEYYVSFTTQDAEVRTRQQFSTHLQSLVDNGQAPADD